MISEMEMVNAALEEILGADVYGRLVEARPETLGDLLPVADAQRR
jgi:hypothetical protein